jgi:GTP-binding protein
MTTEPTPLPAVAIVGRPNVGKSALFNRILRRRIAIVHEESGVTRDRITAVADHFGRRFLLIDTGGLGIYHDDTPVADDFNAEIRQQLTVALEAADAIVFVVDVRDGVTPLDREVARLLRESKKPVTIAANKADTDVHADAAFEMMKTGFDQVVPTSCTHNRNIGELLDVVVDDFPVSATDEQSETPVNLAIIGRPNVGKSTTINRLLGEERVIVSDIPGTTRDAVDIPFTVSTDDGPVALNLIDTAGIKRRRNLKSAVEFFSTHRTAAAVRRADIIIIVLDGAAGVTSQDKRICRTALDAGKPCILLANKWDLAGKGTKQRQLLADIRRDLPFIEHAPLLAGCAVSGYNFKEIFPQVLDLLAQMQQRVPTAVLNSVLQDTVARTPPPRGTAGALKIFYGVYKSSTPPTFLLFVNRKKAMRENYQRFLQSRFRQAFDLHGLPVVIELAERRPPKEKTRGR